MSCNVAYCSVTYFHVATGMSCIAACIYVCTSARTYACVYMHTYALTREDLSMYDHNSYHRLPISNSAKVILELTLDFAVLAALVMLAA